MLNRENLKFVMVALAMTLFAFSSVAQQAPLLIKITNVKKNSGKIIVVLYKDKASWLENPFKTVTLATDESLKMASFDVLPGKYAVSVYQDTNQNGELDMNFLSIPKEPVGFGNNYKPFGKPKFESALIEYNATSKPETIKLF